MDVAQEIDDRGLQSAARLVLGATEENAGNLRRALEHFLPLVANDTPGPDLLGPFVSGVDRVQALRATAHHWIALTCVELGEFPTGFRLVSALLQETEVVNDVLGTARLLGLIAMGRLHKGFGDFNAAIHAYEAARAIYRDDCHVPFSRALLWGLGLAYALAGRLAEGIELLESADQAERRIGSASFRPMRMLHIGRALLEAGRIDEAAARADDALTFAREDSNRSSEAGALGLLGEIALRRNPIDHEAVEDHVVNALRLAETHEMRPVAARCHQRLAWFYYKTCRPESERHDALATMLLEQMGRPRSLDAAGVH
jgi:tetratricopeptide (TPR) repeat protein